MSFISGLAFWKCGSRKLYAARFSNNTRMPSKRAAKSKRKATYTSCFEVSDDSDEDFTSKNPRGFNQRDIQFVNSEISEIKSMVSDILQVNQILSLPLGVVKLLRDAFMCKICHVTPMKPPVIATRCCSSLLGCEVCVNTWYDGAEGLSKKCPYCNEPRGYAFTFQFKGMDEFLVGVRDLVKCEGNSPNN